MLGKPTLLCIDDESTGLMIRKLLLESAGYQVLTALDGHEGLRVFEAAVIDAVIVDYLMPGLDGGRVAARMRQIKPRVPILMLSAYIDLPHEALQLVDAYVTKGQPPAVLLGEIHAMLLRGQRQGLPGAERAAGRDDDTPDTNVAKAA